VPSHLEQMRHRLKCVYKGRIAVVLQTRRIGVDGLTWRWWWSCQIHATRCSDSGVHDAVTEVYTTVWPRCTRQCYRGVHDSVTEVYTIVTRQCDQGARGARSVRRRQHIAAASDKLAEHTTDTWQRLTSDSSEYSQVTNLLYNDQHNMTINK